MPRTIVSKFTNSVRWIKGENIFKEVNDEDDDGHKFNRKTRMAFYVRWAKK